MLRRAALLGVLVCCVALLAGCVVVQPKPGGGVSLSLFPPSSGTTVTGGSSSGGAGGQTQGASSGRKSGKPVYPGKTQTSGAWKVTITTTHIPEQLPDGSKPASGKKFLVVDVSIQNVAGGNALTVVPNQFALWDPKNQVVDPYPTKMSAYNAQGVRPLIAGMGGYTSFVYQVPKSDAVYTFVVSPKQPGTDPMSWYVP